MTDDPLIKNLKPPAPPEPSVPFVIVGGADGVIASEVEFHKLVSRAVDHLILLQLKKNEAPTVVRFQRIQKLTEIGAALVSLYAESVDEVQPLEDDMLYGGIGLAAPGIRPLGVRRNRGPQYMGGDQAELIRSLLAVFERTYGRDRDAVPNPADVAMAAGMATGFEAARGAAAAAQAEVAVADARTAMVNAEGALADAREATAIAEAAVSAVDALG